MPCYDDAHLLLNEGWDLEAQPYDVVLSIVLLSLALICSKIKYEGEEI